MEMLSDKNIPGYVTGPHVTPVPSLQRFDGVLTVLCKRSSDGRSAQHPSSFAGPSFLCSPVVLAPDSHTDQFTRRVPWCMFSTKNISRNARLTLQTLARRKTLPFLDFLDNKKLHYLCCMVCIKCSLLNSYFTICLITVTCKLCFMKLLGYY